MSPLVIRKMDATGSSSKKLQHTNKRCIFGLKMFHIWAWQIILSDKVENILTLISSEPLLEFHALNLTTQATKFPITLPKKNCGLQRSSLRPHFVQRRETPANMDNNQM